MKKLFDAVEAGDIDTVRKILRVPGSRMVVDQRHSNVQLNNVTPLMLAAMAGHTDIAMALVKAGASMELRSPYAGNIVGDALMWDNVDTALALIRAGANPLAGNVGGNLLVKAAKAGSMALMRALLLAGMHPNERDSNGQTAIYWAKDPEIAGLLRLAGATDVACPACGFVLTSREMLCPFCGGEGLALYEAQLRAVDTSTKTVAISAPSKMTGNAGVAIVEEEKVLALYDRLDALMSSIGSVPLDVSRHFGKEGARRFDAGRFLTEVFDLIHLDEGYVLDYAYFDNMMGGCPEIYTRRVDEEPRTYDDLKGVPWHERLKNLTFDPTVDGFYQLAMFETMSESFYRTWHMNYMDHRRICHRGRLPDLIRRNWNYQDGPDWVDLAMAYLKSLGTQYGGPYLAADAPAIDDPEVVATGAKRFDRGNPQRGQMPSRYDDSVEWHQRSINVAVNELIEGRRLAVDFANVDLRPRVIVGEDGAVVCMATFTKWGGFYYDYVEVGVDGQCRSIGKETIYEYHCGITF